MIRWRLAALLALLLVGAPALADPVRERHFGLPRDVSLDGHRIDALLHFTLVGVVVVFALVSAVLVVALVRHRREHATSYTHGTRASVALVLGFVGLVAVAVDGNLFIHTLEDMNRFFWDFGTVEQNPNAVRIEVTAHQWAWLARYPGPDGKFSTPDDVVTLDDIRVPVGVPVVVQLTSADVIHSLYLPNLRVKQDAVPGATTRLTFQGQVPGEYEIACAQHCGPNHYKMRGILTVLTPAAYQEWLSTVEADARRSYDPDDADAHWGWAWRSEP